MVHTVHNDTTCNVSARVDWQEFDVDTKHHSQARLFIVEDEILVARELEYTLVQLGYTVVGSALSAEKALQDIPQCQPDLVLMDIYLPGQIDGIEATRLITENYNIPVIYLTAYPGPDIWQRAKPTRPFGYLIKPWTTEELVASVDIAISRHQSEVRVKQALEIAMKERQHIENSNKIYSRSLSMTTHELRNFLSVVTTTSELLQADKNKVSPHQRQRLLSHVQRAVHDIDQLLDDLVLLTDNRGDQIVVQPTFVEMVSFCQDLIDSAALLDQSQHSLTVVSEHPRLEVFLDSYLLGHIIRNLLSNALKYSPPNTAVTLRLSSFSSYIRLCVEDEGIGIPSDFFPHLFQMFQRASNVQDCQGSGVGLALVKRCVELQGGTISASSHVNQGSSFTVVLPQSLRPA